MVELMSTWRENAKDIFSDWEQEIQQVKERKQTSWDKLVEQRNHVQEIKQQLTAGKEELKLFDELDKLLKQTEKITHVISGQLLDSDATLWKQYESLCTPENRHRFEPLISRSNSNRNSNSDQSGEYKLDEISLKPGEEEEAEDEGFGGVSGRRSLSLDTKSKLNSFAAINEGLKSMFVLKSLIEVNDENIEWLNSSDVDIASEQMKQLQTVLKNEETSRKHAITCIQKIQDGLTQSLDALSNIESTLQEINPKKAFFEENQSKRLIDSAKQLLHQAEQFPELLGTHVTLPTIVPAELLQDYRESNEILSRAGVDYYIAADTGTVLIRAATIDVLIDLLTCVGSILDLRDTFFTTFVYFMSADELLQKLIFKYCIAPNYSIEQLKYECDALEARKLCQIPRRMFVLVLLQYWIVSQFDRDFAQQPATVATLKRFLAHTVIPSGNEVNAQKLVQLLNSQFQSKVSESTDNHVAHQEVDVDFRRGLCFTEFSSLEIAKQITLVEWVDYNLLRSYELVKQAWNKPSKLQRAPVLTRLIQRFNALSGWVRQLVVSEKDSEKRARVIRRVIVMAMHLLALNNFASLIAVLSGLSDSSIKRLRKTWQLVGNELHSISERLSCLMKQNMSIFRNLWTYIKGPAIPYYGMFLTDLTFLEDGNPTYREDNMINFSKFQKIHSTIRLVLRSQQKSYPFEKQETIYRMFETLPESAPEQFQADYDASVLLESHEETKLLPRPDITFVDEDSLSKIVALRTHPLVVAEYGPGDSEFFASLTCTIPSKQGTGAESASNVYENVSQQILAENNSNSLIATTYRKFSLMDMEDMVARMRVVDSGIPRGDHRFRMKVYKNAFSGTDAVDWMMTNIRNLESRQEAVALGQLMMHFHYFRHVTNDNPFKDRHFLYIFNEKVNV